MLLERSLLRNLLDGRLSLFNSFVKMCELRHVAFRGWSYCIFDIHFSHLRLYWCTSRGCQWRLRVCDILAKQSDCIDGRIVHMKSWVDIVVIRGLNEKDYSPTWTDTSREHRWIDIRTSSPQGMQFQEVGKVTFNLSCKITLQIAVSFKELTTYSTNSLCIHQSCRRGCQGVYRNPYGPHYCLQRLHHCFHHRCHPSLSQALCMLDILFSQAVGIHGELLHE